MTPLGDSNFERVAETARRYGLRKRSQTAIKSCHAGENPAALTKFMKKYIASMEKYIASTVLILAGAATIGCGVMLIIAACEMWRPK